VIEFSDDSKFMLGLWLNIQRVHYCIGNLSHDRLIRLDELVNVHGLRMTTIADRQNDENGWANLFDQLLQYGTDHDGDFDVPRDYFLNLSSDMKTLISLGIWLDIQRTDLNSGHLSQSRAKLLEILGDQNKLRLTVESQLLNEENRWNVMYSHLLLYGKVNGDNCNVPPNYMVDFSQSINLNLGAWLATQRYRFNLKSLPQNQLERLDILCNKEKLKLVVKNDEEQHQLDEKAWSDMFNHLIKYGAEHSGDCNVPSNHILPASNIRLGMWLTYQRNQYKSGNILRKKLETLQNLVDNSHLVWEVTDSISNEQQQQLNEDENWIVMFDNLVEYGRSTRNYNVSVHVKFSLTAYIELKLGVWLDSLRHKYKAGTLSQYQYDKVQKLVESDGLVINKQQLEEVDWNMCFQYVLQYGETHFENYNVPYWHKIKLFDDTELKLGEWLNVQRAVFNSGKLPKDKFERLKELEAHKNLKMKTTKREQEADDLWNFMYYHLLDYGKQNSLGDCNVPCGHTVQLPNNRFLVLGD